MKTEFQNHKSLFLNLFAIAILFFGIFCLAKSSWAATVNANSCSQDDVQTAIDSANPEDTVTVPACPSGVVWNSSVTIDKGITLKGAGVGQTVIIGNVGEDNFMVSYMLSNLFADEPFVLSGFTFDANFNSLSLQLGNSDPAHPVTKVRVHHNAWLNCTFENSANPHNVSFRVFGSSV